MFFAWQTIETLALGRKLQEKTSSSVFWSVGKVGNEARQTPGQAECTRTVNEPHLPEKAGVTVVRSYPLHTDETHVNRC